MLIHGSVTQVGGKRAGRSAPCDSSCESSDSGDPEEDRLGVDIDELRTYDNQKVMFVP